MANCALNAVFDGRSERNDALSRVALSLVASSRVAPGRVPARISLFLVGRVRPAGEVA